MPNRNIELRRAYNHEYHKTHREQHNRNGRKFVLKKAGWTVERCKDFEEAQQNKCAICRCPPRNVIGTRGNKRVLCADHDHVTKKPRGLLCHRCNVSLGLLDDSADRLEAAAKYLRYWQEVNNDD